MVDLSEVSSLLPSPKWHYRRHPWIKRRLRQSGTATKSQLSVDTNSCRALINSLCVYTCGNIAGFSPCPAPDQQAFQVPPTRYTSVCRSIIFRHSNCLPQTSERPRSRSLMQVLLLLLLLLLPFSSKNILLVVRFRIRIRPRHLGVRVHSDFTRYLVCQPQMK